MGRFSRFIGYTRSGRDTNRGGHIGGGGFYGIAGVGSVVLALAVASGGILAASTQPLHASQAVRDVDSSVELPESTLMPVGPPTRLALEAPARRSPTEIAREALPAVVEVVTYKSSGERLGGGSGFLVGHEGLVVTSHHVLEGAVRAEVLLHTGEVFEVVHVAAADDRRDLAVLRIAGYGLPTVWLGHSRHIEPGDPVVVIGSPLGLTNTVTHGLMSAERDFEGRRVLQISAPISSGSSGGPVFDDRGRVVGVLAGFHRRGQNVNFAVPIEYARGLLELPPNSFTVESVGRKRVSLLNGRAGARDLSLQAVLRGEAIPGEEETPWALQPRRVDADRVRESPPSGPADLVGLWEIRELTRVPRTRSGLYRGVLASDGTILKGSFFGSLVRDPEFDASFAADRVREFEARLQPEGRATLTGEHGCTYYVHASPDGMAGVYECVDSRGAVYDVGAVEARRIGGAGPSGVYEVAEETALGSREIRAEGKALLFALPDGRWLGRLMTDDGRKPRAFDLREGRWTADGHLSAQLEGGERIRVRGTFGDGRIDLRYHVGGSDFPVEAALGGVRIPDYESEAVVRPETETGPEAEPDADEPEAEPDADEPGRSSVS